MITARHRSDYLGEFVLTETRWRDGIKNQHREWIPNPIENLHVSGRAAVIGSDADRDRFDHARLRRHRGGLLGSKRLQTYGSGVVWQQMVLDFWISTQRDQAAAALASGYCGHSTAYSSIRMCFDNPGNFFVVPFQPVIDDLAAAVYLAAFDGHREVFLLGYSEDTPAQESAWQQHMCWVFDAYASTQFWLVGTAANMPAAWRSRSNVDTMDHRRFVTYCDV